MTICPPGEYNQQNNVQVLLQLVKRQSIQKNQVLITTSLFNIHFETGDTMGQIILSKDKDYLSYGSSDLVEIKFTKSCILFEGQSLIIREGNQIIGFGKIVKLLEPLSSEDQQKIIKGRTKKEKEQFKSLTEKIKNELNPIT